MFVKYCHSLVSEYWLPARSRDYVALLFCALEHLTRSPKYVTLRSLTFLEQKMPERLWYRHQSDKNAIAAQIDPRSGHLKQDRFKLSQFQKSVGCPRAAFKDTADFFWFIFLVAVNILRVPIWILGKSLGSLGTFNSFVSAAGQISMFIQVWRGFYICLFTTG